MAYNLLTAFPLSDALIEAYSEKLLELDPDITPQVVKVAVNSLIMGFTTFDNRLGIQNLREATQDVKKAIERMKYRGEQITDNALLFEIERFKKAMKIL